MAFLSIARLFGKVRRKKQAKKAKKQRKPVKKV